MIYRTELNASKIEFVEYTTGKTVDGGHDQFLIIYMKGGTVIRIPSATLGCTLTRYGYNISNGGRAVSLFMNSLLKREDEVFTFWDWSSNMEALDWENNETSDEEEEEGEDNEEESSKFVSTTPESQSHTETPDTLFGFL
jgi:hypothetical protein